MIERKWQNDRDKIGIEINGKNILGFAKNRRRSILLFAVKVMFA
jgi:hypothetical protein